MKDSLPVRQPHGGITSIISPTAMAVRERRHRIVPQEADTVLHLSVTPRNYPEKGRICTLAGNGVLRAWETDTGEPQAVAPVAGQGVTLALAYDAEDSSVLRSVTTDIPGDGTARLWPGGRPLPHAEGEIDPAVGFPATVAAAFSADGSHVATVAFGETRIRLWGAETAEHVRDLRTPADSRPADVALSPDGTQAVASLYGQPHLCVWRSVGEETTEDTIQLEGVDGPPRSVAIAQDQIVALLTNGELGVWDAGTGKALTARVNCGEGATAVTIPPQAYSHGVTRAIVAAGDNVVFVDLPSHAVAARLYNVSQGYLWQAPVDGAGTMVGPHPEDGWFWTDNRTHVVIRDSPTAFLAVGPAGHGLGEDSYYKHCNSREIVMGRLIYGMPAPPSGKALAGIAGLLTAGDE